MKSLESQKFTAKNGTIRSTIVIGLLLSFTGIGIIIGVPMIIFGLILKYSSFIEISNLGIKKKGAFTEENVKRSKISKSELGLSSLRIYVGNDKPLKIENWYDIKTINQIIQDKID